MEDKNFLISCKVKPGSAKTKILMDGEEKIIVYLHAQAKENKANVELKKLLSKVLRISQSRVEIVFGEKSKNKLLKLMGINRDEFITAIEKFRF